MHCLAAVKERLIVTKVVVTRPIEAPSRRARSDHLSVVVDGIGRAFAEIIHNRVDGTIGSGPEGVRAARGEKVNYRLTGSINAVCISTGSAQWDGNQIVRDRGEGSRVTSRPNISSHLAKVVDVKGSHTQT